MLAQSLPKKALILHHVLSHLFNEMFHYLKCFFVLILVACIATGLFAQNADSTLVLEGKSYTLHRVKTKETLFSIAESNKIELAELLKINRLENSSSVKVNDLIIIPLYAKENKETVPVAKTTPVEPIKQAVKAPEPVATSTTSGNVHTVKQGETLYSISRQYGSTPAVIMSMNGMTGNAVKIGQDLKVPGTNTAAKKDVPAPVKPVVTAPAPPKEKPVEAPAKPAPAPVSTTVKDTPKQDNTAANAVPANDAVVEAGLDMNMMQNLKKSYETQAKNKGTVEAVRGVATIMQEDTKENQSKFYAFHKDAPVGTIMKVRNMMNNKTAYVKVIGKLADSADNQNVIVKVSAATGKFLNVLDPKFQCEVTGFK
jgi:LysM repeat protein